MNEIEKVGSRAIQVEDWTLNKLTLAREALTDQVADVKSMIEAINDEILRRAAEKNASVLFTDDAEIEISYTEKIDYRIDKLRTLQGKVPDELFNKAVYLEPQEPVWKTSATVLKQLAKKYGTDIAEIVEAGMPKVRVGSPKIKITRRNLPKTVVEIAA